MTEREHYQFDPNLPEGQEAEIVELNAQPYEDNRRVLVTFRLSPFSKPPGATIHVVDSDGKETARTDLVNILHLESEITVHLPADSKFPDKYTVNFELFRLEDQQIEDDGSSQPRINQIDLDSATCSFELP